MEDYKNTPLNDGTKLCLECGLCCTGLFHTGALIYTKEDKEYAKAFNAEFFFDEEDEYFKLPCPVYEGKCTIYPHNPSVCQKHECDLLKSINDHQINLGESIDIVHEMKKLVYNIEHDLKSLSMETNTKHIPSLLNKFFTLTSKEERKDCQNLLKNYAAFLHLKRKRFYKSEDNSYL